MLLGMAGYKSGYLTGDWSDRRYRSIAFWTLSIGALASAAIAYTTWRANFYLPLVFFNLVVTQLPFRIMMALGYAALIILVFRKPGWVRDRFAAVGRAAFTNYLGTSIIAAPGLLRRRTWALPPPVAVRGLAGRAARVAAHARLVEALARPVPVRAVRMGWRSLARWELQPMRKKERLAAA